MEWREHGRNVEWCKKIMANATALPYMHSSIAGQYEAEEERITRFDAIMGFLGYDKRTAEMYGFRFIDGFSDAPGLRRVLIPISSDDFVFLDFDCKKIEKDDSTSYQAAVKNCHYGSRYERIVTKDCFTINDTIFVVRDVREAIQVSEVGHIAYAPKYDRHGDMVNEARADFRAYLCENTSVNEDGIQVAPIINVVVASTYFDVDGIKDICKERDIPCVVRAIFKGELGHIDALREHKDEFRHVLAEAVRTIKSPFAMPGSGMVSSTMYIDEMMKRGEELFRPFASLGLPGLDAKLGGGVRDGLIVLAAEHGMCKTSLSLKMACDMAHAGYHVRFYSLEMNPNDLLARCASRISYERLGEQGLSCNEVIDIVSGGDASDERKQHCKEMLGLISKNLHLGSGKYDVNRIRSEIDEAVECGFGSRLVVFIDYLQNMVPMGRNIRDSVETSVDGLAEMCRVHRIPVIVISAINREGHGKAFDEVYLRESGKIEYAATVILGLQFHGAGIEGLNFDAEKEKATQEVDVIIRKNRFGDSRGVVQLQFHRVWSAFTEVHDNGGAAQVDKTKAPIQPTRVRRDEIRSAGKSPRK